MERGRYFLRQYLESLGHDIVLRAEAVLCGACLTHVTLKDERTLLSDLWLVAIGIQPTVELAQAVGLTIRRGVVMITAAGKAGRDVSDCLDAVRVGQ